MVKVRRMVMGNMGLFYRLISGGKKHFLDLGENIHERVECIGLKHAYAGVAEMGYSFE